MARIRGTTVCYRCRKFLKNDLSADGNRWLYTLEPEKGSCEMCGYNGNVYQARWIEGGVFGVSMKTLPNEMPKLTLGTFVAAAAAMFGVKGRRRARA